MLGVSSTGLAMFDRRHFLHSSATALILAGPAFGACATRGSLLADQAAAHVLNRLGFGPRPGDLALVGRNPQAWIEQQLAPASTPLPASLTDKLRESVVVDSDPIAVLREFVALIQQNQIAANAAAQTPQATDMAAMREAAVPAAAVRRDGPALVTPLGSYLRTYQLPALESRLFRALESPRQLEEVMVDFWFNHFNVFQGKNLLRVLVGNYEHHAIRPFAMGRFRDLLVATAHHPAMLYYLDNWQSIGTRADGGVRGLNENYARELMELHTLGVDGGYTQRDVTELARMLTGWTLVPLRAQRAEAAMDSMAATMATALPKKGRAEAMPGFWFNERVHDRGSKHWLGQTVAPQGKAEGDLALEQLARHPATARHISRKLVQYFVSDRPDAALVDSLAKVFIAEDGQIVPVLRALFASDAFWAAENVAGKFKTPYHYAVSTLRASGATLTNTPAVLGLAGQLAVQGMPLFGCPTPDGYKNTEAAWLNPDGMSKRINFAAQVAAGRLGGSVEPEALMAELGPLVTPATRSLVAQQSEDKALAATLVLAGPGMMRR